MKDLWNIKRFKLYGWIGVGVLALCLLVDAAHHTHEFFGRAVDEIWFISFVTAIDYFFFEYSLPRLQWKKFWRSFWLVLLQIFLISKGFYMWKQLGVLTHIYTVYEPEDIQ